MPLSPPTPQMKLAASKDFWYEVTMLQATNKVLRNGSIDGDTLATNAFLESFALHARALLVFFFGPRSNDDNAQASDYFDDPTTWPSLVGTTPAELQTVRKRANKEIAHLSYYRQQVKPQDKPWDTTAAAQAIMQIVTTFSENADPRYLAPRT